MLLVVLSVIALVPIILALVEEGLLYRSALLALGVLLVLFVFYVHALASSVQPGIVRVREAGGLSFVPSAAVGVLPFAVSVVGMVVGVLALLALVQPGGEFGRGGRTIWGALIIGVLASAWLVQNLFALRRPVGLRLSSWGLEGVRGGPAVRVPWDLITEAKAVSTSKGAELRVVLAEGTTLTVHGQYLGSDPSVVAAIVEYYRAHPEQDELLAQPVAAVRRVEAASS